MVKAQEWLDKNFPKEERKEFVELITKKKNLEGDLVIEGFEKLKIAEFRDNSDLVSIKLVNLPNLNRFNANGCSISSIEIRNCPSIGYFNVGNNLIESVGFLKSLNSEKVNFLSIHSNNFEQQDLSFLNRFVNLEQLYVDNCDKEKLEQNIYNRFSGSLEPLSNLNKLRWLCISNTNISEGLEYLPSSVKKIGCNSGWKNKEKKEMGCLKILKELEKAREFLGLTEKEMKEEEEREEWFVKDYYRLEPWRQFQDIVKARVSNEKVEVAVSLPPQLNKKTDHIIENYDLKEKVVYNRVYPTDHPPFFWQIEKKLLLSEKLPLRLYHIEENQVKETKSISKVENYAMLSYAWGSSESNKNVLSKSGAKSLKKSIETCNHLGIKYLWMDQLCIDQGNQEEKEFEIPKMRQYYSSSLVTLIAIHTNAFEENELSKFSLPDILEKIINSEWFSRSWTFQEGLLSKQTIFMFDDVLVDGREIAALWALHQPAYAGGGRYDNINEFNEGTKKIATPVGWTYYRNGYKSADTVSLNLSQALRETKKRKRCIPVDGIYSILGLLPYGKKVKVDYSLTTTQALINIMKVAMINGYGEPLSWYGESSKEEGKSWLPIVSEDGSVNVKGGINVLCESESIKFTSSGNIELKGVKYSVYEVDKILSKIELGEGFLIDEGMWMRDITLKLVDEYGKRYNYEKITLLGSQETLEKIEREIKENECFLLEFSKEEGWKGNKPFALLVKREGSVYSRIGLVELFPRDLRKLREKKEERIIIGGNSINSSSQERIYEKQTENREAQIEVPPK